MKKILFCCEPCSENAPEWCGHHQLSKLRVQPDGSWVCAECWGEQPFEYNEGTTDDRRWADLPRVSKASALWNALKTIIKSAKAKS